MHAAAVIPSSLPVDLVNLPFLGGRTDTHALFQYVLIGGTETTVDFAVPGWVALREHIEVGAKIVFHLPFRARQDFFDEGEVIAVRADTEQGGQVASARLTARSPLRYPVYADPASGAVVFRDSSGAEAEPLALARALLRDCELGKQGVRVYFKHLVPLFSRITLFPTAEYAQLRTALFDDIRNKIEAHVVDFARWSATLDAPGLGAGDLPAVLDLDAVRVAIEPEINNELFGAVFATPAITQYLCAIRLIERRLCLNYNTLVLLYAAALRR